MSTQLIPFSFESHEIRAVVVDGSPLFGSRDVALALDYADPSQAYKLHCKSLKLLSSVECTELGWANPNPRGEYVMPEPDVYRLITKSNKPEAERFEKWIFEEVLPSIRKTGGYAIIQAKPATQPTIREERELQALARDTMRTLKAFGIVGNAAALSTDNYCRAIAGRSLLEPLGATHLLADPRGHTYTPSELGQRFNPPLSAIKFNLLLESAGLQTKEFGAWMPTDAASGLFEWLDTGKRHSNGVPVKQIKWFQTVLDRLPVSEQKEAA